MLNLDSEIQKLLKTLTNKSLISKPCLDEIEDHIRLDLESFLGSGLSPEESLSRVRAAFGPTSAVVEEFKKLYGQNRFDQARNYLSHYFNRRIIMRLFFGLFLGFFFILGGMLLEGGQVSSITQVTGIIIVAGGAFGALLVAYPFSTIKGCFVLALTGRSATKAAYLQAAAVFKTFGDLAFLAGFIGLVLGLIHVFEHMDRNPDVNGAGLAVAVTAILYALVIKLFIGRALSDSFLARAEGRVNSEKPLTPDDFMTA